MTVLSNDGLTTHYSTYLGGTGYDYGHGVAIDADNNAYVAGRTSSTDFPNSSDNLVGGYDAFVAKFNENGGNEFVRFFGGTGTDYGYAVAAGVNAVFVTGITTSSFGVASSGAYDEQFGGGYDAFVAKLASSDGSRMYSTYLGGTGYDYGNGIAADAANNAYVVGYTDGGIEGFTNCSSCVGGGYEAYVAKLNAEGTALSYGTYVGGTSTDAGQAIDIDDYGRAYIAGYTYSTDDFPTAGSDYQAKNAGNNDAFVSVLDSSGQDLVYSSYLGGALYDYANGIAVAPGAILMTGYTTSSVFPTQGAYQGDQGGSDAFVVRFVDDVFAQGEGGEVYAFDPGSDIRGAQPNLFTRSYAYNYPIPLPPGRGGLTPALGISYNSSRHTTELGHYSTVGTGWSLLGENYISRPPNDFTAGYTLVLNGATYTIRRAFDGIGSAGDLFVKENPFIRVQERTENGDYVIDVTTPEGTKHEFRGRYAGISNGNSAQLTGNPVMEYRWSNKDIDGNRKDIGGVCNWNPRPVRWIKLPLMQVRDVNGNTIDYTWQPVTTMEKGDDGTRDSDDISDPSGDCNYVRWIQLKSISYNVGMTKVEMGYVRDKEDRPDSYNDGKGWFYHPLDRLTDITVTAAPANGVSSTTLSRYELEHTQKGDSISQVTLDVDTISAVIGSSAPLTNTFSYEHNQGSDQSTYLKLIENPYGGKVGFVESGSKIVSRTVSDTVTGESYTWAYDSGSKDTKTGGFDKVWVTRPDGSVEIHEYHQRIDANGTTVNDVCPSGPVCVDELAGRETQVQICTGGSDGSCDEDEQEYVLSQITNTWAYTTANLPLTYTVPSTYTDTNIDKVPRFVYLESSESYASGKPVLKTTYSYDIANQSGKQYGNVTHISE
ncbi:MAG: hypothetical protein GY753_18800, partial [Gammaproteobacteria bacterium]|nr:hypothetical protein [Gammaproteobacteria bacterium]